jgi:hypothetical protein
MQSITRRQTSRRGLAVLVMTLASLLAVGLTAAGARVRARAAAGTPVPQGFVGMDMDGPLFNSSDNLDLANQMDAMVADGVQAVRVAFNWAAAMPYANWNDVPPDQRVNFPESEPRPTNFSETDEVVQDAAEHGLSVLPTILYTPHWDARKNPNGVDTPKRAAPYAQYAAELVRRYGPSGTFWSENPQVPKRPITMWQIWNEPNLSYYWRQPFAPTYVPLLRLAHNAIKKADPSAKVVLGALTNVAWKAIGTVYKMRGARRLFDVVSVNGFTKTPADVLLYMHFMRRAMAHYHDGTKPLVATELSWPSALGQSPQRYDFDVTTKKQASNLAAVLPKLAAQRARDRLIGFYWYTWIGDEYRGAPAFNFSGLLREHAGTVSNKPALAAYRTGALKLEGCTAKGSLATICLH